MKKLAITISLLAGATVGYAQGTINWSDYAPANSKSGLPAFSISIFGPATPGAAPVNNKGNTSSDLPAGTATYAGAALNGTGFEVGLYVDTSAGAVSTDVTTGLPVATDTFSSGFAGRWDISGGLDATVSAYPSGTAVFVELAAWSTTVAAPSYAAAAKTVDLIGTSLVSSGTTALGGGLTTPGTLAGIGVTDFSIGSAVPEPNTIALGVMGASAFLMRLRRKN
jgi:hypothetical protein